MTEPGDIVYVRAQISEGGSASVCGWCLEVIGEDLIIGCPAASLEGVAETVTTKVSQHQCGYLRVSKAAASGAVPQKWSGMRAKDLASYTTFQKGWKEVNRELKSSEAELMEDPPLPSKKPSGRRKGLTELEEDLAQLQGLFGEASDDSEEDEPAPVRSRGAASSSFLPPGAPAGATRRVEEGERKEGRKELDLQKMMALSLAQGRSAGDLMPLLLLNYMEDKKQRQRRRKQRERDHGYLGGYSSEDSAGEGEEWRDKGMRAVSSLHQLQRRIQRCPRQIYQEYEREITEELGVVPGQAWTLKDYLRRQPWGRFKGIFRCAVMDAQAYEYLRAGNSEAAMAQLVQNMKAKVQAVLQQGDWTTAWLLTGIPDPLAKREFGGTKEELAVISGYMDALSKLRKRMKETGPGAGGGDEDDDEVLSECGGALLDDEAAEFWGKSLLNEFVAWSNFVVLGCPECRDGRFEPRVVHRSMEDMRSFADRLLGEVVSFSTPELLRDTLCCEGKRGDLQSLLELLSCSTSSYDDVGPQVSPEAGVALPVVAERVAVPAEAGLVDPADWLEPDRAAVFENLDRLRLPEELWGEKVVACHRVPLDQEEAVIRKLLETNMVTLVPEGELPRDGQGDIRVGGLFSVRKNDVEDRLIYDRRPENATMPRLRWAELPNGACYCRLLLKPHEYVRGSGDDLRNFYYMLRLPEAWIRFNSVGRRVSKELLVERGLDPSIAHRACFRVLGMGDVNGCAIAQATHESILRRAGLLEPDTVLIYGRTAPQSDLWEGIYLDDLLDEDMRRMAAAEAAYLEVWSLIRQVVRLGHCTQAALQKLVGLITFHLQYRREMFCLQHHIYKFMSDMPPRGVVRLPTFVLDELRSLGLHLPFCYTSMRRWISEEVLATDATPTSGGAVVAQVPEALARELWRLSEHRGEAVRLDRTTDFEIEVGEPKEPSIFASVCGECLDWNVASSYHFRKTSHINLQEARALKKELASLASDPANHGMIKICLNDSRVCVGAFAKGRSSSFRLNGCLRSLLPFLIFGNVSFGILWIETHSNPGDYPSRFTPLPVPRDPPRWLRRFGVGGDKLALPGLEVFAGTAVLTAAFIRAGCAMLGPVDLLYGKDALEECWAELIRTRAVAWVWLSPPCSSFSPLTNLGAGGPLRTKGQPEADASNPRTALGNLLWRRAIALAELALKAGIPFFLEHPKGSYGWLFREIELLRAKAGVTMHELHMCAYSSAYVSWCHDRTPAERRSIDYALSRAIEVAYDEGEKGLLLTCLSEGQKVTGWARRIWWATMLASWLAFWGLMRPGEVVNLRKKDLAFPEAVAMGEAALGLVILIRKPKTRRTYRTQMVLVKEVAVVLWLSWWTAALRPNQLVFPMSRRLWGERMKEALRRLSLEGCKYTPSSFRAGGATHHYRVNQNIPQLQFMGRWKSLESLKSYIHEALSVHIAQQAPEEGRRKLESAQRFVHLLQQPPHLPAQLLQFLLQFGLRRHVVLKMDQGVGDLVPGAAGRPQADAEEGQRTTAAATTVRHALQQAAAQLGPEEIEPGLSASEVVADASSWASASRWRSGSNARRFTAALCRMLSLLEGLRPDVGEVRAADTLEGPQPVEPRPLRGALARRGSTSVAAQEPQVRQMVWSWLLRPLRLWKTCAVLLLVLICPRLVALLASMIIRLLCRAMILVLGRVAHELWQEVRMGISHASLAVTELELQLVELLESWMGWPNVVPSTAPPYLTDPSFVPSPPPTPAPGASLPARPLEIVHLVLMALLYRRDDAFSLSESWDPHRYEGSESPERPLSKTFMQQVRTDARGSKSYHRHPAATALNQQLLIPGLESLKAPFEDDAFSLSESWDPHRYEGSESPD
ncbi:unnamed protein product [Symbiodinium natans]|uniref:Tyr recombinase domain-containing protein n=1 Tax=Symbiodinium natans TaxID=878477 RepID=A0A812SN66_9DINO|nr:unnamed protein product [Symbiodinium natans]